MLAQRDRTWYRLSKSVKRNKVFVSAAATALLALLSGAALALWQARVAQVEKNTANEIKDFVTSIFRDANPYQTVGKPLSAVELLQQAKNKIDQINISRIDLRVELLNLVASSLIGLDDVDAAEAVARQAMIEARRLPHNHRQSLHARLLMAQVHRFLGRTEEMRHELQEAMPALRSQPSAYAEDLVLALENRAHLAINAGEYDKAQSAAKEGLDLARARLGEKDPRTVAVFMVLAESYEYSDKRADVALGIAERAFQLASNVYQDRPKHPRMIEMRRIYGRALARAGQVRLGIEQMRKAVRDASDVFGPNSPMVGSFTGDLARFERRSGDIKTALETSTRSLDIHPRYGGATRMPMRAGLPSGE